MESEEPILPPEDESDILGEPMPPQPVKPSASRSFFGTAVGLTAATGAVLLILASTARPTMGSTRSCKLQWQERQQQVDQQIAAENAAEP